MLQDEASIVTERVNSSLISEVTLFQLAVAGILDKKANKSFAATVKKLVGR